MTQEPGEFVAGLSFPMLYYFADEMRDSGLPEQARKLEETIISSFRPK